MEITRLITGFVLLIFGGLSLLRTDLVVKYRVWVTNKIYGAEYKPSKKTYKIQKIMGVLFILIGLSVLVNIL